MYYYFNSIYYHYCSFTTTTSLTTTPSTRMFDFSCPSRKRCGCSKIVKLQEHLLLRHINSNNTHIGCMAWKLHVAQALWLQLHWNTTATFVAAIQCVAPSHPSTHPRRCGCSNIGSLQEHLLLRTNVPLQGSSCEFQGSSCEFQGSSCEFQGSSCEFN